MGETLFRDTGVKSTDYPPVQITPRQPEIDFRQPPCRSYYPLYRLSQHEKRGPSGATYSARNPTPAQHDIQWGNSTAMPLQSKR